MRKLLIILAIVIIVIALASYRVISRRACGPEVANAKSNMLGMSVRELGTSELNELGVSRGVSIAAVYANSPAENHGLQPGDVILSINGDVTAEKCDYMEILDEALIKRSMVLKIRRNSEDIQIRMDSEYASSYNNLGTAYFKEK